MPTIHGWVAPGYEAVREAFEGNFAERGEVGAAYAAHHHGRPVVDLWGGVADQADGRPWQEDTTVLVFSTTKGVTAMCANRLAQEGRLDVEAPVAEYWPEFARAGKEEVTVAQLLSHQAGLPWVDGTMSFDDVAAWDPVAEALARQAPAWAPGTAHGYHATTYGWLVGEVVRRVTGRSLGTYLREELAAPLGIDFAVGLPADQHHRVARLISFFDSLGRNRPPDLREAAGPDLEEMAELAKDYLGPDGPLTKALAAPGGALADQRVWNRPELWSAEVPAANGIGDARSLAKLYAACVGEVPVAGGGTFRVLEASQLQRAAVQRTAGPDRVLLGLDLQWGLGFLLQRGLLAGTVFGGGQGFGHFGSGGSVGWGDPEGELGMGYVMNRMSMGMAGDIRSYRLMAATVEAARREG